MKRSSILICMISSLALSSCSSDPNIRRGQATGAVVEASPPDSLRIPGAEPPSGPLWVVSWAGKLPETADAAYKTKVG